MTIRSKMGCISLLGLVLGLPAAAWAQDSTVTTPTLEGTTSEYPKEFINRPNTLHAGMVELHLHLIASLSKDAVFKPFVLAPHVHYGVTDKLQIGIVHNSSLCLAGKDNGCPMVYNDTTLDAYWNFIRDDKQDFNLHAGIDGDYVKDTAGDTKVLLAIRAGVYGSMLLSSTFAIYVDPFLSVGVTERDLGNKESFGIPVRLAFQATPEITPLLDVFFGGPFKNFGDNITLGVGVGVNYAITNMFDIIAEFTFNDLVLPDGAPGSAADNRSLLVGLVYRIGK